MIEQAVLIGLAAYRVAFFFVEESGPFGISEKLRTFVGIKPGPIEGFFPQLFSCMFCMTVWTTLLAYLLWEIDPRIDIVLAAMSVALVVNLYASFNQN